jgi:inositol transport system substrate-binding protein
MKKMGLLALAVGLVFASCAKSKNAERFTVGYANCADAEVFFITRKNAVLKSAEGTDINFVFSDANNDIQRQLDQVDTFIAQKVNLLIIVPVDSDGVVPAIERANKANIPVICLGIQASGGENIFVGSENYDSGYIQGELAAKLLPQNAKILYLAGSPGFIHSQDRRIGFNDALKTGGRTDVVILSDMSGNYLMDQGMKVAEDWIQTFPQFDGIIAANDQMALGALEALKTAGRLNNIFLTGIDGVTEAVQAVKDGTMTQTVLQNGPGQGAACVEVIQKIRRGEAVPKEVLVPFESITIDNVDEYL